MTGIETVFVRHPEIEVDLIGRDGNAFAVLGAVSKALRQAGHGDEVAAYMEKASAGDYNHLLKTTLSWVTVI